MCSGEWGEWDIDTERRGVGWFCNGWKQVDRVCPDLSGTAAGVRIVHSYRAILWIF